MTNKEKNLLQISNTIEYTRNKPINSTLTERWFLLDEATKACEGLPQPLVFGKGMAYILERASTPIEEYDILLGRFIDKVPTSEEEEALQNIWVEGSNKKHPIVGLNRGHRAFDWETLVNLGLVGYIKRTEDKIKELESSEETDQKKLDFYSGMLWLYKGIQRYIQRYSEEAAKKGMSDCAEVCSAIALSAPKSFKEAMQLVLMVYTVYTIYAGRRVACLTLGRMDNYLLPFYLKDIENGILTEEEAGYIIDDFNCKLNLHLGRGEHQMASAEDSGNNTGWFRNPAYDSPTYIVLDGYCDDDGVAHTSNPLTRIFAEHIVPELKEPVYIYRWTKNHSDDVWTTICDRIRRNASILVYNDETMIPAMLNSGVEPIDARAYTVHACNWPDIAGGYFVGKMAGEPIPYTLYNILFKDGEARGDLSSVDQIYEEMSDYYRELIAPAYDICREKLIDKNRKIKNILCYDDCFLQGPFENGCSAYYGGVKYIAVYNLIRNIGTAADIMAAVDTLVFKERALTLKELFEAMQNNFEGFDDIYAMCKSAPKFGTDNDVADDHAMRLMNTLLDVIDQVATNEKGVKDVIPLNVTITDMDHIKMGRDLPATPDGRYCGAPLSENLSPTVGYKTNITSVLNSVSKLPFDKIHAGAHNVRLSKNMVEGDNGLNTLKVLLDTYFGNGGMQIQVSIADTKVLKQAQITPDEYKDLMVRITGYSAVFTDMSKKGQDEVIRRDEM